MNTSLTPTVSAHAARNPSKPVQPPRQRTRKSDAGSSTQKVNDAKLKKEEMLAEVEAFQELRHEKVKELAIKYEKDKAFFLKLLANRSQYSATRGLTLWNAVKHNFSKQAKENGDAKSTIELNEELKYKYEELKESMSEDKKKELLAQLEEHRELQHKGNAARIGEVMKDLYERTGVRAFAMFTRGNPDDPSVPHIEDSDEAHLFFLEHLKMDILDVMRKFEQWSCTRDSGGPKENHKLSVIMKEISEILSESLQQIKNDRSLSMEYMNYRYAIVHQLGVELAGWPSWVEMTHASKLSAEHARDIHQKLRSGAIHWVALTKSQRDAVTKEIEEQRAQGPLKPCKQHSDKGEERGPQKKPNKTNTAQDGEVLAAASSAAPLSAAPSVATAAPADANAAVPSAASTTVPSTPVPSAANTGVPSTANTAVPSAASTTVPSTASTAIPSTANMAVPSAADTDTAVPSTGDYANDAPPTTTHDPLSITANLATFGVDFFDNFAHLDSVFNPLQYDYRNLEFPLSSLPSLGEDATPTLLPELWLNVRNIRDDTEMDEPAGHFPMTL
ncbi:hypothetical protein K438DRAFT_2020020 [Mycena galopus ATCC 62051]|nr:hypothetical protein K438DRAFT_2020020 [Mycena galopus ATCC 62051]